MKWMRSSAAAFAAFGLVAMAGSAVGAPNPQCKKGCDNAYQSCQRAGRDYSTCMKTWGSCKKGCDPAKTAVMTPKPMVAPATVQKTANR